MNHRDLCLRKLVCSNTWERGERETLTKNLCPLQGGGLWYVVKRDIEQRGWMVFLASGPPATCERAS